MAILMTFLLMVTWLPAMVLLLVQVSFAGSFRFCSTTSTWSRPSPCSPSSQATMVSAAMLALSSLSNNSRFVGILYAGLIFFSDALFGVLRVVTRAPASRGCHSATIWRNWVTRCSGAAALIDAVAGVADDGRRARSPCRSSSSIDASAASR